MDVFAQRRWGCRKSLFDWRRLAGAALLALLTGSAAAAATVTYTAVDLPDAVGGSDRWRYDYTISGAFTAFDTLTVEFGASLFDQLDLAIAPSVLEAQPILPAVGASNGLLVLSTTSDLASLLDSASVSFVWLGSGPPGAQDFSVATGAGAVYQTGVTVQPSQAAVPEPAPWALLLAALMAGSPACRRGQPAPRWRRSPPLGR